VAVNGVGIADGRELALKVSPPPDPRLSRYEVDLGHTEIECHWRGHTAGVPVSTVHHADPERGRLLVGPVSRAT
jgi:hypothetical protein